MCNGSRGIVVGFDDRTGSPLVEFSNRVIHTIEPFLHEVLLLDGTKIVRKQVPLKLAWAVTMHKSQGMTLDALEVSLNRTFSSGQAYVGLSRARSMAGLRITGWDGRFVPVCERVLKVGRLLSSRYSGRSILYDRFPGG